MVAFWKVFARVMVSLLLLCNAIFSRLGRVEFEVSWLVDPIEVTDTDVEIELYATLISDVFGQILAHQPLFCGTHCYRWEVHFRQ